MEIWFKEFESYGRQILVKKTHNAEESKVGIQYCWPEEIFEVEVGPWIAYDEDDDESCEQANKARDELFEATNQEVVDNAVSEIIQMLKLGD
ncbi:TPA: hypothetical protein ACWL3X_003929 [Proteus mirabilis]